MQLTRAQQTSDRSVVLGKTRQDDGPKGQVHPHPECVCTDDDAKEPGFGEPFHKTAVLGQHASVMNADAMMQKAGERATKARCEPVSDKSRRERLSV